MTQLLEQAFATARALPNEEQDEAGEMLLLLLAKREGPVRLDDETYAAVQEGLAQERRGEFAMDEEVAAVFNRYR
jgi:hypothetical protein